MRFVRSCVPLLALACAADQVPSGHILVIAEAATAAAQITRVTVTITPSGVTGDLAVDPLNPTRFTGMIEVPVGAQTVRADAYSGVTLVGTGSAPVDVAKGVHVQALITIVDATGPAPGPDHSPVVTSVVLPLSAQVDDQWPVTATAMDGDGDALTYSWSALPTGCGIFANPAALSTTFTARLVGSCTVTFTATAKGKSDAKSGQIQITAATGFIDVTVDYVPQPVIASISFFAGGQPIATVSRTATDATIRTPFHKGTLYTVTVAYDPWSTGTITLTDSCNGTIGQPQFVANAASASGTWTPTVDSGACIVTARIVRGALSDSLFVVVLPAP